MTKKLTQEETVIPELFKKLEKDYQKYLRTGTMKEQFVKALNDLCTKVYSFETIWGIKLKLDIESVELKKWLESIDLDAN